MDVADRARRLRGRLGDAGAGPPVDALLVTNLANIRYLTGFTGSAGRLLVSAGGVLLVTDGRYDTQAAEQTAAAGADARIEIASTLGAQDAALAAALDAAGAGRLGLEAADVTWGDVRRYAEPPFAAELVATSGVVEALREVKDDGEIARLAAASAIADAALATVRPALAEQPTEAELGLELDTAMRRLGADGVSFETIVASGPNGAKPHHRPGRRRISAGDLVVLDFGALVDGYHSDMTRTVVVGEPSDVQRRMLDVVGEAQAAGVAAVRAGVDAAAVDAACRDRIERAGWGDAFVHGTGHGIGLDIHEAPRLARTATGALRAGQVITVEPGVYLPEHGGVRIEDSVVVTDDGCRPITLAPKHWRV
ncbi:MAG: M24 family metallopeptidase [Actinobacteria bacterium]|nr:M24 family metallopeptidase [Actinomycetota bacterium]